MAKKTQIVCQHLENISRSVLEEYQDIIRDYIRGRHGIYALYRRDKLYYVGLASNLRVRLKQHLHDKHGKLWDRFSVYLTIDDKAIKELETLMLRILKKSDGNRAGGRFVRSQNLALQLGRDIREHSRVQLRHLLGRERRSKITKPLAKDQNGVAPPLAQYFKQRVVLRAQYKHKKYKAYVRRDGTVRFDGVIYRSPSAAASAVRRRATNGWHFWSYERAPGDWVRLMTLRR